MLQLVLFSESPYPWWVIDLMGRDSGESRWANNMFESELSTTADWAIRVTGADLRHLFKTCGRGYEHAFWLVNWKPCRLNVVRDVKLKALDAEGLLVEWLSELAYWAEMEQIVFRQFDLVDVTSTSLKAIVRGGIASCIGQAY